MSLHQAPTDTECYPNYWLLMLAAEAGILDFEIWDDVYYIGGVPVQDRNDWIVALAAALRSHEVVTFNGNGYDLPITTLALSGSNNGELKRASDAIIVGGLKPWEVAPVPEWIQHIDLIEVAPGQGSLKAYAAKMHSERLQDLPIAPGEHIDGRKRSLLREYCGLGDLPATRDLAGAMSSQIALRRDMSAEYSIDLMSKSDAQMAEAVMKRLLPFKVERAQVAWGAKFFYRPPAWLQFKRLDVLALLARSPFTIADNGSPVMTEELASTLIRIGGSAYQMGSGGLHSTESKTLHVADAAHIISDHDVASYYPSLILATGIYPPQIGPVALEIYRDWYDKRLAAKARYQALEAQYGNVKNMPPEVAEEYKAQKKKANSLKTLLNGWFGKLGSPWSIAYAPSEMIQVTITGQLALLMLIERLEEYGIAVISANTDGIVLKTPRDKVTLRNSIIAWWETTTGLVTEAKEYRLLASRDVNSYVAIGLDGEAKCKGAFAPPEPGPSGWPNPTGQISVDAAIAWLRDGTPLERTVHACTDIRQFLHVRKVTGGGSYCPLGMLSAKTTQKAMRERVGNLGKDDLLLVWAAEVAFEVARRQYLGKTVRWYYGRGAPGCIATPKGGLVARTEGAVPLMQLGGAFPADVDHAWYIAEARDMLVNMGAIPIDGTVN